MPPRYAVYLAPPADSALWAYGSAILGYDAQTGAEPAFPDLPGFDADTWREITTDPRRYGFHGTLKAPFRLADGRTEAGLVAGLDAFAATRHPFELPPLDVRELGAFIALIPSVPAPLLLDLAGDTVVTLDAFRAPLSDAEMARRRPDQLSARQSDYLARYGYPYVLDEFRFHMTLTGPLAEPALGHAANALRDSFAASGCAVPLVVESIALYRQDAPEARFRIVHRSGFGGSLQP